jgi:hypothetical protein
MSRRVVVVVLALLVVVLGAPAAQAAQRSRVTASFPTAVPAKGTLLAAGRLTGSARSITVVLQQRNGKRWVARAKKRMHGASRRFTLRWRVPAKAGTTSVRVVLLRGHRQAAKSPAKKITILPASAGTGARVALGTSSITAAPPSGAPGQIRTTGNAPVSAGDVVAAGVSPATPNGYLGRATAVGHDSTSTVLTVTPTTLIDAVPQGSFNMATGHTASARSAKATERAAADAGTQAVDRTVSCEAGGTVSVTGSLSITPRLNLSAHWGGYSFSHPLGQLDTAALTASVTAAARLEAKATGTAGCTLDRTRIAQTHLSPVTVFVLGLPVVLVPTIDWNVKAGAKATVAIDTSLHGSVTASAGVSYQRNVGFRPNGDVHSELGFDPPTVTTSAHADAALEPVVSVLIYGLAGPSLNLSAGLAFDANPLQNPWWKLTAPVKVTASLDVPDLNLHSGELPIYDHSFDIAHAEGAFPRPPVVLPPPPPPPVAPTRQLMYWFQTDDLQCSLATVEDAHEAFFSIGPDDACGAFLAIDGQLYGPATIPAGQDLGDYVSFTPLDQQRTGDGTAASPNVQTTTVAAGDTGVTLVETDTWTDNGDHVDTTFAVAGASGDTRVVRLYQGADCYVADDDFGTGQRDAATGAVGCVHSNADSTALTMSLTPLSSGASSSEKHYSDIWVDIANQGPLDNACTCATNNDNGFGLSWPIQLQGTTSIQARSRIALHGSTS